MTTNRFPLGGPLSDDKKNIGIIHDKNGSDTVYFIQNVYNSSSILHNEASNFFAVPYFTMQRFPKYFIGIKIYITILVPLFIIFF